MSTKGYSSRTNFRPASNGSGEKAEEPLYVNIRELGSGSFGQVQLAYNRQTGEKVAIKLLQRGPDKVTKNVERELRSHISFCHPHVVRFKNLFLTETHLAVVLEYVDGGDLFGYCSGKGPLPEDEARRFFQQLVIGIDYCHKMGVVNRDVKLENALLDASHTLLKITDFGYAKTSNDSNCMSLVGTPGYAAPEVVSAARKQYDGTKADMWSCGVMLYVMLFHSYPFERADDPPGQKGYAKVLARTLRVDYRIPSKPQVSKDCVALISKLLVADPQGRLSTEGVMKDPWFRKNLPPGVEHLNEQCLRMKMGTEEQAQKEEWIRRKVEEAMTLPGMGSGRQGSGGSARSKSGAMTFDESFEAAYKDEGLR
ncbi:hypothetical protein WJX73_007909 [Symbiochloris irregularis]|uniref:Protein kinase domain-containing protein n=1 Tax=Symbiochloris irregularis TaxID=706552 RepID=A0AAW1NPW8_9CHLO